MKTEAKRLQQFIVVFASITVAATNSYGQTGIASKYPNDIGIQNDSNVIFIEMFEEPDIAAVVARWTDHANATQMALVPDVPIGSTGNTSIRFTTVGGSINAVNLYKLLSPGINDSLFLRYYVKYNTNGTFHHSGGGIGGYNPPSNWPLGAAGIRPMGSNNFGTRVEPYDIGPDDFLKPKTLSRIDYYTYWMGMRGNPVPNTYFGNFFINDPAISINLSEWTCIELMVKLNNPVTSCNGAMALWINGKKVSDLKQGSPTGKWVWDTFTPGVGSPFEGFQWRNDANLNINYISISHYVTKDANGQQNSISYDHVVVAKSYIGPIQTLEGGNN